MVIDAVWLARAIESAQVSREKMIESEKYFNGDNVAISERRMLIYG